MMNIVMHCAVAVVALGCRAFTSELKPLPPVKAHDEALEDVAARGVVSTGIRADPIHTRIVRILDENPMSRLVDITVVVKSRVVDDLCTWATIRYRQGAAGIQKLGSVDQGRVDCKDPELRSMFAQDGPATANPQAQAELQATCAQAIARIDESYCHHPPGAANVADLVRQQRDALAINCKDAQSTVALAGLDKCVGRLRATAP
jgi:hypothetical protein